MNAVNAEAPSNNISLAAFTTNVAAAFADDAGGVINFDGGFNSDTAINANYGVSGTNVLGITAANTVTFTNSGNNGAVSISGNRILQINGSQTGTTFTFDTDLTSFGLTALSRTTGDRTVAISGTLSDGSTFALAADDVTAGTPRDDTFFGYQAPAGLGITSVTLTSNSGTLYDDLAFTTAIPEPASAGLAAVGGLLVLARRRR